MSIPSLLYLCSQPTLSAMPTCTIYTYLVWHDYLSRHLLYLPMQSSLPTVVFYVYTVLSVYGQNCIVFYTLLLTLRILAAVPTQSPLPTIVFYAYTVPVSMDRIV